MAALTAAALGVLGAAGLIASKSGGKKGTTPPTLTPVAPTPIAPLPDRPAGSDSTQTIAPIGQTLPGTSFTTKVLRSRQKATDMSAGRTVLSDRKTLLGE